MGRSGVPTQRGSGRAAAKVSTYTPLGMTTASPPTCCTTVRRASSDTAIRAAIFSNIGTTTGEIACRARERSIAEWKVATTGPCAAHSARMLSEGLYGSCRCRTSKAPSSTHRRTRAPTTGPKASRATEPLYGIARARPAGTT